ncbi:CoA transferase [Pigmentiphaga sp. YJ18]|uniref:CaiB/BaiF CoA transferase family protein n=1 Tax=Pigmentiphaga sp. YJ18 TaxID=3134907 RepID=UPI00311031B6
MFASTCLSGRVVLDLGQLHPGPQAAFTLGQLGATVIKVERPDGGDAARALGAETFAKYNRGKLSIALDLKRAEDRELLLALASRSHALVENFRPGVMERLGLGYARLSAANPALVMCSISGYGQDGPYAARPGHDMNFLAGAGYWAVPSQIDDVVARPRVRLSDYCGSMYAALALVVAMMTARESGRGEHLDLSLQDAMTAWTAPGIDALRHTGTDVEGLDHVMPDNDVFRTADGRHLVLGILEDKFWLALSDVLAPLCPGLDAAEYRTRRGRLANKRELSSRLKALIASRTLAQWAALLDPELIPWTPVPQPHEWLDDAHVRARGMVQRHPDGGLDLRFPVRFSGHWAPASGTAPALDQHRAGILAWLAGGAMPGKKESSCS